VVSEKRWVIMHELRGEPEPSLEEQIERVSPCDLLLVEGHKRHPLPKLEVWRRETGNRCYIRRDEHIVAIASDTALEPDCSSSISTTTRDRKFHPELQRIQMNKGLLNVDEALEQLLAGAHPVSETEMVPTLSATSRVLAAAQRSTMNVPPMDNSAMDGYAVRLADLQRPDTRLKVTQKIPPARSANRSPPEPQRASSPRTDPRGCRRHRDAGTLRRRR